MLTDAAPSARNNWQVDRATLFALPQDRRPQLQDFRLLTPNFGVIPASEPTPPANVSLNSLMQSGQRDDDATKRKNNIMGSQVVPTAGAQVVIWTVTDPD